MSIMEVKKRASQGGGSMAEPALGSLLNSSGSRLARTSRAQCHAVSLEDGSVVVAVPPGDLGHQSQGRLDVDPCGVQVVQRLRNQHADQVGRWPRGRDDGKRDLVIMHRDAHPSVLPSSVKI
jgi:hypothetical protein